VCAQVQYPNALPTMMLDLSSIRQWAGFLQKTEIKFDMLSAVDELASQVPLEQKG
jgi:predicted unusual protein kinase regulating ubiquinone biosynthesis (AarF/ABC1/UbiB family)